MRISDWSSDVCSSDLEIRRIEQDVDLHTADAEVVADHPRSGGPRLRGGGGGGGCYIRHEYLLFGRGRPDRRDRIEGGFGKVAERLAIGQPGEPRRQIGRAHV